ncbi:hypothetical protein JOB18_017432, partial [Solea senegalensis]
DEGCSTFLDQRTPCWTPQPGEVLSWMAAVMTSPKMNRPFYDEDLAQYEPIFSASFPQKSS